MIRQISRLRRYSASERRTLLTLGLLLPLASAALRLLGFVRTQRLVNWLGGRGHPPREAQTADYASAQRLADLARLAGHRHLWPATCLRQSLVVSLMLRRKGLDARIRIGVANTIDRAPAHAWVELEGVSLDPKSPGHMAFGDIEAVDGPLDARRLSLLDVRPEHDQTRRVIALVVTMMIASALAGAAPWSIRSALVQTPWPDFQTTGSDGTPSSEQEGDGSCPAPWSRPRPDAMGQFEAGLAFGNWPTLARVMVDLAWIGLLALGIASWRRRDLDWTFAACVIALMLLASASAAEALWRERWLELLAGSRATIPWLFAAAGFALATTGVLRGVVIACTSLLALQGPLAMWELDSFNSPYGTDLLGMQTHRLVGTFDLPAALGAFAVATWAAALCWLRPGRRALTLLSVLVAGVLLVCSSASAWVAWAITAASVVFFLMRLRWRIVILALALPSALALWLSLPSLTGRNDVHSSLWGRIAPVADFSRDYLDTGDRLFGFRFGVGTQGYEALRLMATEKVEPPNLRPPTDSTPAVLYWQFGAAGVLVAYALLLLALAKDARSRPVGIALIVGSLFVSLAENLPLAVLLAFWLAHAARRRQDGHDDAVQTGVEPRLATT